MGPVIFLIPFLSLFLPGIGITNRYALFLDEESDPLDILKASEADKLVAKTKKIEAASKPAAKTAPKKETGNKNDAGESLLCLYYINI